MTDRETAEKIVEGRALNDRNDPHEYEALVGRIESTLTHSRTELAKRMVEAVRTTRILSDEIYEIPQGGTITEMQIPFTAAAFKEQAVDALKAVAKQEGVEL